MMSVKSVGIVLIVGLLVSIAGVGGAFAQDRARPKDDSLESLLKELNEPEKTASKSAKSTKAEPAKPGTSAEKPKQAPRSDSSSGKTGKPDADKTGKLSSGTATDKGKVSAKDQALDDLLEKLGETKDQPAAEDHPRSGSPGGGPQPPSPRAKSGADKLEEKDKDLDTRLEELTGRKKKRSSSDQERTGAVGEMIKEMREVEERLGKPDSGEDTQKKQKEIVKRIETMIEQAKRSGSSGMRMVTRRIPRPGDQQGQQDGDRTGAQARGAQAMKPAKPTSQHSTANGKEVWGHLPDELRQIMEASFKEEDLDSKRDLITRYFLSVAKGKPVREE